MSDITSRIDSLLANRNLRRVDLYKNCFIPESTFRSWVKGSKPSAEALKKCADFLGVSMDFLTSGTAINETENIKIDNLILSEEEKKLVELFRNLSDKDKNTVLILASSLNN